MSISAARIRAVVREEFRDYRRNRFVLATMAVLPVVFFITPVISIFRITAAVPASVVRTQVGVTLLLLLLIPVVVPATIAAYSVVGERDQGTLEPVLTTPIRRDEFLLGKAVAAIIPSVGIAYALFAVFVTAVRFGASHAVVTTVWQPTWFLAQLLFTPLLAGWSIWVGTAISARSTDVRAAQQLGTLASLPPLALTSLILFRVIHPSVTVALVVALALAVIDIAAWRVVSTMFDRERLITGMRPSPDAPEPGAPCY
jgi:ABC-2 type transport system permease protein